MSTMSMKQEVAQQLVLSTPGASVTGLYLLGYPLSNYIAVGTALLVTLQIGYLLHKWVLMHRNKELVCPSSND